jgi:predicted component of type VI protein secretion system
VATRTYLTKGQRDAAAWAEFADSFVERRREADDSAEGPINRAFRQAYEGQAGELDAHRGRR